jgi:hypothetical protein
MINENPKRIVSLVNRFQGYSIKVEEAHIVKLIPIPNTIGKMVIENIDNSDIRGAVCFTIQIRMVVGMIYLLAITKAVNSICLVTAEPRINLSRSSSIFRSNSFPGKRNSVQIAKDIILPCVNADAFLERDHTANNRGKATIWDR